MRFRGFLIGMLAVLGSTVAGYSQSITFVGANSAETASGPNVVLTKPAGVQVGDIIIIQASHNASGEAITVPSGFISINNGASGDMYAGLFYKIADGTEGATFTIAKSNANNRTWVGMVLVYRNVNRWNPFEASPVVTTASGANGATTLNTPSITAVTTRGMLIGVAVQLHNATETSINPQGSMTERADRVRDNWVVSAAEEALTTTGATGTRTFTFAGALGGGAGSTRGYKAYSLILRPSVPNPFTQAPVFVGAADSSGADATITLRKPTGVVAGDLILIQAGYTVVTGTITAPAGFTTQYNTQQNNLEGALFYRIADGTEGATFTMALGANRNWMGSIAVYRNVNRTAPFEAIATTQADIANAAATFNAPTVTALTSTGVLVNLWLGRHSGTPTSILAPTYSNQRTRILGLNRMSMIADEQLTASGATGTRTATFAAAQASAQGSFATSIVLRAAVNAGNSTKTPSPTSVYANGSAVSTLTMLIRDSSNNPILGLTNTDFSFSGAGAATINSFAETGSGNYTYNVTNATAQTVTITPTVSNVSLGAAAGITFRPGPPNAGNSVVAASPTSRVANGVEASTLTVTVRDASNRAMTGLLVGDFGFSGQGAATIGSFTDTGSGIYTFSVTNMTVQAINIGVTVEGVSIGTSNTITFTVGPPNAGNSDVSASPLNLPADGLAISVLTVEVRDAGNNVITGLVSSNFGFSGQGNATIIGFSEVGSGVYTFNVSNFVPEVVNISVTVLSVSVGSTGNITFTEAVTVYSYQSGSWDVANTWTLDPSGTTLTGSAVPTAADNVVILNGRTVTKSSGSITINTLNIQNGGFLDVTTTTGHSFGVVSGQGRLRQASVTFPAGTFTSFVSANGGTVEFYDVTGTLPTGVATYNNLVLTNSTVSNHTFTQASNITLNGSLTVSRSGSGTLTLQHGDNTTARSLSVSNGVNIGAGTSWTVVNANQQGHTVSVNGDFINNGTVAFTNQAAPNYTTATTTGAVILTMTGNQSNTMTLNGTTKVYRFVLDKGIDDTHALNVNASTPAIFELFGPNNLAFSGSSPNITSNNALSLLAGTLRLGANIVLPSLSSGTLGYSIDEDVSLWLDGATVITNAVDNAAEGIVVYGSLRVSNGATFTENSNQGLINREQASILIEGGSLNTKTIRTSNVAGTHRGAFTMTGGTVTIRGDMPVIGGMENFAPFTLPYSDNSFSMSGGTMNILTSSPLAGGSATNFSFVVGANPENIEITGGTINITVPATRPAYIASKSPFWNLNITSTASSFAAEPRQYTSNVTVPDAIPSQPLVVLNNLQLQSNAVLTSGVDVRNVTVGGNFNIASGTTYTPGANTTTFNGSGAQLFTLNGTITSGLHNLGISKSADTLKLAGSNGTLTVLNQFNLTSGVFADDGKTVEIRGDMTLSGRHIGSGKLQLTTATSRTISGNGSGSITNMDVSGPASAVTVTLNTALEVRGTLAFITNGTNNRIFNIGSSALTLTATGAIAGANSSAPVHMIRTAGFASDGGLRKVYNGLSFTFPVGTGTLYTPATIALSQAPSVYGTVTVRPVEAQHPNVTALGRSLTYYWKTTSSGFTLGPATVSQTYVYDQSDVVSGGDVTEAGYVAARYNSNSAIWTSGVAADVDESTNTITFSSGSFNTSIDGEYTAGDNDPTSPFGTVLTYYSYNGGGNWNNVNTWSLTGHNTLDTPGSIPAANSVVRIGDNDVVTVVANGALSGNLGIEAGSVLDLGTTTGHNFGEFASNIAGNGRLRISSSSGTATFPSGSFAAFLNSTGGTVEYYRTATNFTIPSTSASALPLAQYRNLVVNVASNTGGVLITLPSEDLIIHEDLTIQGLSATEVHAANTVTGNLTIQRDLLIQSGGLYLPFNSANVRLVSVANDVAISTGAVFGTVNNTTNVVHELGITGSLVNNGTFNLFLTTARHARLTFLGSSNKTISGTTGGASTTLYQVVVNKGTSRTPLLDVTVDGTLTFAASTGWLTLTNGTFRLSRASTMTITNTATSFTIPATAGLAVNHASAVVNIGASASDAADLLLAGILTISSGTVNIGTDGNNNNNDIEYASAGLPEIVIAAGSLNVNGQIRRLAATSTGSLVWRQTGGDVVIRGRNVLTSNAKLEIANTGSVLNMSGGTITIRRGGSVTFADAYLRPASSAVTGGTILFAPGSTIGAQSYTLDATAPLWNVTVQGFDATHTAIATLQVNSVVLGNNLTVTNHSTLAAGSLNITVGGTFLKESSGTFTRATQTVFFDGASATLNGSFTTQSFHNLQIQAGKSLTLAASTPVIVANNLVLGSAATLSDGGNLIEVRGAITNNGTHSSASNSSTFGIELDGSSAQTINGKGAFGNLIINNPINVSLTDSITINRRLALVVGILDIGAHKLTLGANADVTGSFSATRMIRANGVLSDGGIAKAYSGTGSFSYPIGVFGKYTPATINVTATSSPGIITIKPINTKHPSTRAAAETQLNYYWNVTRTGFSSFTASHTYTYIQTDVTGTESNYRVGRFVLPNWTPIGGILGALNTTTNVISLTDVNYINGDYTVGEEDEFAGVATYYSRTATAGAGLVDWTLPSSWSIAGHDSAAAVDFPAGAPVIIAANHQIRGNINFLSAESIVLNSGAILDLEDSYGHAFGVVSGTGKIRIKATASNQYVFPGGNYESLNGPGGGITEFYGATNGILPTQTFYNVVRLIDGSTRTQSNVDLTIYGNWLLEGGVVSNTSNNRNITLWGDWRNTASASAFVPGTGKLTLAKTTGSQVVGGSFSSTFGTLEMNGAGVKKLEQDAIVNTSAQFTNGMLVLDSRNLILGSSATISGTPSASSMIVTNSTGVVRKRFTATGSITIPIGDTLGTDEYSPITVNLASGTFGSDPSVDVKVTDGIPPSCGGSSYVSRYWNAVVNDITSYSLIATPRYLDADIVGTEADLFGVYKIGAGDCGLGTSANLAANTVSVTVGGSPILITAGNAGAIAEPTVQVTNLAVVNVTPTSIQLSWTAGNGVKRLVVAREGFAVNADPNDGVQYTADANFSGSPAHLGSGNYVVYAGTGTGVTVTGLDMNTVYHFRVYEYNEVGINTNYLLTSAPVISRKTQITTTVTISGDRGWRAITSPARTLYSDLLDGFYTQGFTGTTYPDSIPTMLWYDESYAGTDNQRWRKPGALADSVVAGRGHMFYVFGDMGISGYNNPAFALPKAMSVTGFETPLTGGEFNFPITYTTAADSGWNLVGNPLYTDIDWDHASWTKTNMDNSVYVWSDSANGGLGDYLTWNGTTGSLGTGKISAMQAFWVKANAASPVLKVNEAARTTGATFYKETDVVQQMRIDSIPILEFTLRYGSMSKKLHVMFSENGRAGIDREDAWHLVSMNPSFLEFYSTSSEGNPLSIQHLPRKLYRTADVPISVGGYMNGRTVTGPYEIALTGAWNVPDVWELELYDRKTRRSVMLSPQAFSFMAEGDTTVTLSATHWQQGGTLLKATATSEDRFTLKVHPNGEFDDIPGEVTLAQNYPNPFNPSTTITYTVPEEMRVRLEVYDILGRRVATLVDQNQNAGRYQVQFDMAPYASGVYLYRIVTGEKSLVRKMTLIK